MNTADAIVLLFAASNTARVLSYMPQILCLLRDPGDSRAVSLLTWTMFTVANASTVLYAAAVLGDGRAAVIFSLNGFFCGSITAIVLAKRVRARWRTGRDGPWPAIGLRRSA